MVCWLLLPWLCVCVCVSSSMRTGIRLSALCVLVCPYSNSVSDSSQRSLKAPPLSSVRAWADPWSAMAWPQAHLLSWWQMCQRLASDLCLSPSGFGVSNLCQTFSLVLYIMNLFGNTLNQMCFLLFVSFEQWWAWPACFSSFNSLQLPSCFVSSVWLYMWMKRHCPSLNITTLWTAILCASTESLFFSRFIVTVPLSPNKIGCSSFNAQWQSWSTFAKCIEKWEAFITVGDLCNHSDIIHYLVLWPQLH